MRHTYEINPAVLLSAVSCWLMLGIAGLAWGGWQFWQPPSVVTLRATDLSEVSSYEEKIRALNDALNEAQTRALVAKSGTEQKIDDLISRQSKIEARQSLVIAMTETAFSHRSGVRPKSASTLTTSPLLSNAFNTQPAMDSLPENASSYVGTARPFPLPEASPAVHPEISGLQGRIELTPTSSVASAATSLLTNVGQREAPQILGLLDARLNLNESIQVAALEAINSLATKNTDMQKQALRSAGLNFDQLVDQAPEKPSTGGPFVPMVAANDGSLFERAMLRTRSSLEQANRLTRIMPYIPLRRPFREDAEITSGFGGRVDPFNGQLAMHTGIDFRMEYGAPVRPTASGTISFAGTNGGYGNMIDVDHGNGLVTRYGHLSAILAKEGDKVTSATVIGRLGSTGRSTGPHLHYEVRVNDEPVNPLRFIKAGEPLYAEN